MFTNINVNIYKQFSFSVKLCASDSERTRKRGEKREKCWGMFVGMP